MSQLPLEITENGIHYTLHDDYYFPDLGLSEVPREYIGRYGWICKTYLENHRPGLYERLILSGELYKHLAKIDRSCRTRMEWMIRQMSRTEGINDQLKETDQLAWVARMNSIHQRAEEIILDELVFI